MTKGALPEPFILGADISWIPEREAGGVKYADSGAVKDILEILKEHRFNYIRLRLFVDPTAKITGETESPYSAKGYCNLESTRAMAKRVKAAGFKLLLDFHYSDTWADPAKQYKPVSWNLSSFSQLTAKVRSYTKETLELFKSDGTLPDMVQVGNEVVGGMIWPDGKIANMSNFAVLVNAGIDGVKDVDPDIKIMIHSISKNSPSTWLKNLISAGVSRIDVFGLSYYSEWHGTPSDLKNMVTEIASNHTVKIAIAEYADNHQAVNDIIFNLPGNKGAGTFVWEPADWSEALFDWKNNRRETNSRIDIYPQLSKKYGNDDIVSADGNPECIASGQLTKRQDRKVSVRPVSGGSINYRLQNISRAKVSVFTFQGKLAGQYLIIADNGEKISNGKIDTKLKSGNYLIKVDTGEKTHVMFRNCFLH